MCTFVHTLRQASLHPAGGCRTGGGRLPTREPSSCISRSQTRLSTLSLSITFWADWPWSPTARTGRSRMTGTSCSLHIIPGGCAITPTGRLGGVGAPSAIPGPGGVTCQTGPGPGAAGRGTPWCVTTGPATTKRGKIILRFST